MSNKRKRQEEQQLDAEMDEGGEGGGRKVEDEQSKEQRRIAASTRQMKGILDRHSGPGSNEVKEQILLRLLRELDKPLQRQLGNAIISSGFLKTDEGEVLMREKDFIGKIDGEVDAASAVLSAKGGGGHVEDYLSKTASTLVEPTEKRAELLKTIAPLLCQVLQVMHKSTNFKKLEHSTEQRKILILFKEFHVRGESQVPSAR